MQSWRPSALSLVILRQKQWTRCKNTTLWLYPHKTKAIAWHRDLHTRGCDGDVILLSCCFLCQRRHKCYRLQTRKIANPRHTLCRVFIWICQSPFFKNCKGRNSTAASSWSSKRFIQSTKSLTHAIRGCLQNHQLIEAKHRWDGLEVWDTDCICIVIQQTIKQAVKSALFERSNLRQRKFLHLILIIL